jgi:hypothetical protein
LGCNPKRKKHQSRAVVAHAFNPSTWKAEAGGFLSSRPAWSTEWVPGTARATQRNPVSKNKTKQKKKWFLKCCAHSPDVFRLLSSGREKFWTTTATIFFPFSFHSDQSPCFFIYISI